MSQIFQQINVVRMSIVGLLCALICALMFQPLLNLPAQAHISVPDVLHAVGWATGAGLVALVFLAYLLVETKPLLYPAED